MPGRRATEPERRDQILSAAMSVATTHGLDGLTARGVAQAAELSHGLVLFHFQAMADLRSALLDRVLEATLSFEPRPPTRGELPSERLLAAMLDEMRRLAGNPGLTRLFFDFWMAGARDRSLRTRIRRALWAYRRSFAPLVDDMFASEPERFGQVTPSALVAVVLAFIKGSALQAMIDPRGFDPSGLTAAATAILARHSTRVAENGGGRA
jgi:AcrR family transcriptional regulator